MSQLKIAVWNANGLSQHKLEVQAFLNEQNIDVMLVSETHFTNKNFFNIRNYTTYITKHPDGKAHGGTAILIRSKIKHYEYQKFQTEHIQATSIVLEEWSGKCILSAVYCPPRHAIKEEQFSNFFKTLGDKFLAGGDYNAKHTNWGSRLTSPKGKQLSQSMQANKLDHLSSGHPTYWPTDRRKIPDLIDFCVTKGIQRVHANCVPCFELSSDHSPIIVVLNTLALTLKIPTGITNKRTNWGRYKDLVNEKCSLDISLKDSNDIDVALNVLNNVLINAAEEATPNQDYISDRKINVSYNVKLLLQNKRRLRREWQQYRSPSLKKKLNRAIKILKEALLQEREGNVQYFLENLTASASSDYSLWKATRKLKQPQISFPAIRCVDGNWARKDIEKAEMFAEHLTKVFTPFPQDGNTTSPEHVPIHPNTSSSIVTFRVQEIKSQIKHNINPKKAPGIDKITGRMLKELPENCFKLITYIFNAIMRLQYYPANWKISQIIMFPKPGKDESQVSSYRPISLLSILSKLFEKLMLKKLNPILEEIGIIPEHQFGFRQHHGTIEQVHRVVVPIKQALDEKKYCSAAFLDISQAFDKVWHEGLLLKLNQIIPGQFYRIISSYLSDRKFKVKCGSETSQVYPIESGVPQGSVLGPVLYQLFTSDLPTSDSVTMATFADDTAVLSVHVNPNTASRILQGHLDKIQTWLKTWRIKANEKKSTHITFTLKKMNCPSVKLNNVSIPQHDVVKYLGLHLDRRLTWKKHIETKLTQLKLKSAKMQWLLGHKSHLSLENKVLLYKVILKPIWTYGIQLWGSTCASNVELIQRYQSKTLRRLCKAPWYVKNEIIHRDLGIKYVNEVIRAFSSKYLQKLLHHPNKLATDILHDSKYTRLRRTDPLNLPHRFS